MSELSKLEKLVVDAIASWARDKALRFSDIQALLASERSAPVPHRELDRTLQKLRRTNVIEYHTKTGWSLPNPDNK